jgi:hypothetical protein
LLTGLNVPQGRPKCSLTPTLHRVRLSGWDFFTERVGLLDFRIPLA